MPDLAEVDRESHSIGGPRLRLTFAWAGDRWTHALEVAGTVVARPVELPPEAELPERVVSPTYQQINFQKAPDGADQALLVGQCGPHHFSAVFTIREAGESSVLEVDAADRSSRPVEHFAATYTVFMTSNDLGEADERGIRWSARGMSLGFEAVPPAQAALAEAGRSATRVQALARIDPRSKTQRFVYRWTAATSAVQSSS